MFNLLLVLTFISGKGTGDESRQTQVEKFLDSKERAMEKARQKLLQSIDKVDAHVRKRDTDPQTKRTHLEQIAADRQALERSGRLPGCDELIDVTIAYVEEHRRLLETVEEFRDRQTKKALKDGESSAFARLDELDERLNKIVGGREEFVPDSKWFGARIDVNRSFRWVLVIDDVDGNKFRGSLRQNRNRFEIAGTMDGNRIAFDTTEVVKGRNNKKGTRKFHVTGYLLTDRIVAEMGETGDRGEKLSGSAVSLWREGAEGSAVR